MDETRTKKKDHGLATRGYRSDIPGKPVRARHREIRKELVAAL